MSESTNSLLIAAGILLVITLADPCVNSIVSAVRRALQRPPRTAEPETTVNVLERDAA